MKLKLSFCISLFFSLAFSQKEASVWYFGQNAGVRFNDDSSVTALVDGQINTIEGCASIADSNGNLLFYTDGITVWNKNHIVMLNGNGLTGDPSSTQSATIVPMPNSINLFYVFTLDAFAHSNGFRYSIIDMNLDGGNGAVTSVKNILIYTPSNEKLSIVKHSNNVDFWVITHGWNNNTFYSYLLNSSGLSLTPIMSNVGTIVSGSTDNVWGYMKISPNGNKLAICNSSIDFELLDFDNSSGIVSNPIVLSGTINGGFVYGVEFSPDCSKLYVSYIYSSSSPSTIKQFDLNSTDIVNSAQTIFSSTSIIPTALQLAPNNKIYFAKVDSSSLGVINFPNSLGPGSDLQINSVDLQAKKCELGLPPFVSSFFYAPAIQADNTCVGESTNFQFNSNQNIISANWNFGDGNTSNDLNPTHIYSSPGTYTVMVSIITPLGTGTNSRQITIYPQPVLNTTAITLKQCDDNLDGFSAFNLNETIPLLVSNATGLTFRFYESSNDAINNVGAIANPTAYTNQIVSNDIVFVRVENANGCFKTAQINLMVSTTLIPSSFQLSFIECDDNASGSNSDGVAVFDFSSATAQIQALYPTGQLLNITYYKNLADALSESNAINNTSSYSNIGYPNVQNIYVRVDSQVNNECLGLGHHITLTVERIPIAQPKIIRHCDDDQDGIYSFNTSAIQNDLLNGLTNVLVSYIDQNGIALPSPLPNPFTTSSQTINVTIANNYGKHCSYNSTIQFIVDELPIAYPIPVALTQVCDDETDPNLQDGIFSFDTSSFQSTIIGSQNAVVVNYYDAAHNSLPSPLPNPFTSNTQNITAEVINPNNTTCKALITIPFVVYSTPKINLNGAELICSDNPTFIKTIDAGLLDTTTISNYTYAWYHDGVLIPNENNYSLTVNQEGVYTVDVMNANGCINTRTITVTSSNIAIINSVQISDLTDNNSVAVFVTGSGDYSYSIGGENFQDSNYFSNLIPGIYTVFVKDNKGCGIAIKDISILGIPKYFTPNGDGYNDYWNINGITESYNSKSIIYIFDRFGKLLKQITPTNRGWDGTYNGKLMPAEDYWYSIQLEDGRSVKGHFALKR